jgi:hypothetical protein
MLTLPVSLVISLKQMGHSQAEDMIAFAFAVGQEGTGL